jgi:hypothetical protein
MIKSCWKRVPKVEGNKRGRKVWWDEKETELPERKPRRVKGKNTVRGDYGAWWRCGYQRREKKRR